MWAEFMGEFDKVLDREKFRTELPYDKMIQYFHIFFNMGVSMLLVGQNYFSSTISCHTDYVKGRTYKIFVDDSCGAFMTNHSNVTGQNTFLPHKIFPFVYMSQVAVFLVPYLLWQFLAVPSLLTFLNSVMTYCNDLALKLMTWYDEFEIQQSGYKDHFLEKIELLALDTNELIRYWLQRRALGLLNTYTLRHILYVIFCIVYLVLYVIWVPFGDLSVCQFWCQMEEGSVHRCIITNSLLVRVVYTINMTMLCLTFLFGIYRVRFFRNELAVNESFFFRNIPGLATRSFMESLKDDSQSHRSHQYFSGLRLLSSFVDHNESFIKNFPYLKKTARLTKDSSLAKLRNLWTRMQTGPGKTEDRISDSYKIQSKSNKEPRQDNRRRGYDSESESDDQGKLRWKRGSEYATPGFSTDEDVESGNNPTSPSESLMGEERKQQTQKKKN